MKKILSVIFAVMVLVICCVGCENVEYGQPPESSEITSVDIYEQLESQLPTLDVSENESIPEREFTVVTDNSEAFLESETTPSTINTAISDRNSFLLGKYGAKFIVRTVDAKTAAKEMASASALGEKYCDMLLFPMNETLGFALSGLLGNMNELPGFDLENSYFSEISKSLATNSTLYMLPDVSAMVYEDTYVMFFNRKLINESGAYDVEKLALENKWTWDNFNVWSKIAAADVFNKVSADMATDVFSYGHYAKIYDVSQAMWVGCGSKFIDDSYKKQVKITPDIGLITAIGDKLRYAYDTKGRLPMDGSGAAAVFEEGRLVFFCNTLDYIYALRDGTEKGSEYGILPMPKYTLEGGYSCLVSTDGRVFSIPKTLMNADESHKKYVSAVISGICGSSSTVRDAFLKYYIAQYMNNNTETLLLETIIDSVTFDLATVYGEQVRAVKNATTGAIAEYLDINNKIYYAVVNNQPAFDRYASDNFN